ncbi:MAG: hypothetical protein ACLP9L_04820 [Thermoguttaceae bacterium]
MTYVIPTQGNVVVKSVEASGKLFVDYARDLKNWAINKYVQIQPVPKTSGLYTRMTIEEAGRILYPDGRNFEWFDASPAPTGADGLESFEMEPFYTKRRAFAIRLGDLTVDMADWQVLEQNMRIKAQQAMTMRTQLAVTTLTTSTNYANYTGDTSHVMDVTQIPGASGSWADSTTARGDIQRSIETACEQILDDTLNGVNLDDLVLVISSALAAALTRSQEIKDYIKGSPDSLAQIRGELPGGNVHYGLPGKLWGVPVIVEATRKVTNKKGATRLVSQILPAATPFIVARPGSLESTATGPNFATCVLFAHEEMTVEQIRIPIDRLTYGRVVENLAPYLVAPASGVLFQNAM